MERNKGEQSGLKRGLLSSYDAAYQRALEIRRARLADPFGGRVDGRLVGRSGKGRTGNLTAADFSPKRPQ